MPKQRARKKSSIKKTGRASNLWIFIVIGLVCTAIVWYIIRDNSYINQDQEQDHMVADVTGTDAANGEKARGATDVEDDSTGVRSQTLDQVIESTLAQLDIGPGIYRRQKKQDAFVYSVPLNRAEMEMNYANMLFKGYVERGGGALVTAVETGSRQTMTFRKSGDPKTYQVILYYDSKPYAGKSGKRNIAIVVDDFGQIGGDLLDGFLALPKEVTFAIFPELTNSILTMEKAHQQGRETIIHVPMEPIGYPRVDPGKNAILIQMKDTEIDRLLNRFINNMPYCIGINNHMGSLATTDPDVMHAVMKTLKDRDKLFLDSRTSNVSVAYQIAQKAHIPAFRNDIFLDSPDISQKTMDDKLAQILTMSATNSNIIAITHCHNKEKLVYLQEFIRRLRNEGFNIVPLSKIGTYSVPQIL